MVRSVDVNVLVWGSGVSASEHYEKRMKIRDTLKSEFRNADVRFSEDKELDSLVPGSAHKFTHEKELWHLAACDVCVVMDTSQGAGEEIAHFISTSHARKLMIFTHEKYRRSSTFPGSLRQNQNQVFYSELDYASCELVKQILERVQQVALAKLSQIFLV